MHKTGHTTKNYLVQNISGAERTSLVVHWLTFWGFQCRGVQVQSLVREVDPTCCNLKKKKKKSHILQLRPGAVKKQKDGAEIKKA